MNMKSLIPFGFGRNQAEAADPFVAMRREMERVFDDFSRGWGPPSLTGDGVLSPRVDVAETDRGIEVTAELPGVDRKDIAVDVTDGALTIRAEHKTDERRADDKTRWHMIERAHGTYVRQLALPFTADPGKVEATFDKGLLKVVVPRPPEEQRPRTRVEIKAA